MVACRLFGTKPLSRPVIISHQSYPKRQTSIFFEINQFSLTKLHIKLSSGILPPLCTEGGELTPPSEECALLSKDVVNTLPVDALAPALATSSAGYDDVINGNIFRVTGFLCAEFTGHRKNPTQRPVAGNFDVFYDLRLNKPLGKQSWLWWFETPPRSLWRHCNEWY